MKLLPKFSVWKGMLILMAFGLLLTACEKFNWFEHDKKGQDKCPETTPFDLNAHLRGEGKKSGHIKFRQHPDAAKTITLDIWVQNLKPNHEYLLQRAVDAVNELDCNCTSTTWLTLGKGLVPQSILTDKRGNGSEALWRDITAIPTGSKFDIRFQVIDAVSSDVVLASDCHQYQVR